MAKLIGHITWSCPLRRPALSLINAGYRFARTFGPRSGRWWPAVAQEFRWIASLLPLFTCNLASPWSPWVYATDASGGARGSHGVTRRWCDPVDAAATGSCAEGWRFSAQEFITARRSALVEHDWKVKKASWLGVEDIHEVCRVDLHPSLVGDMRENFHAMPDDRAVFENCAINFSTAQVCLVRPVWRCLEETNGNLAVRGQSLRHGTASCLSVH